MVGRGPIAVSSAYYDTYPNCDALSGGVVHVSSPQAKLLIGFSSMDVILEAWDGGAGPGTKAKVVLPFGLLLVIDR